MTDAFSMTVAQQRKLQGYVNRMKDMLGLRDWRVTVMRDIAPDAAQAFIWCAGKQKVAEVSFGDWFVGLDPDEQRATVVHELIHAHYGQEFHLVRDLAPVLMPKRSYGPFLFAWDSAHEYGTDGLACAIAHLFPYPPEL